MSDELMNAKDFGYKIKVLKGYTFQSDYIFKNFVDSLYEIKCNSASGLKKMILCI